MSNTNIAVATRPNTTTMMRPLSLLIQPVAQNSEIINSWKNYQELKSQLLNDNDYQIISGRKYIKKSGWRKLQTAFGISDEIVKEDRKTDGKGFSFEVTVKVSTQNGRFAYGVGSCSSSERSFAHVEHDVRSTAHTRAKNRAISDLIGGGEVSYEEIETPVYLKEQEAIVQPDVKAYSASDNYRSWENRADKITTRQEKLLRELAIQKVETEDEREALLAQLPEMTKYDASQEIDRLINWNA